MLFRSIRFLYRAIQAIGKNDIAERRIAIKRTLDILMHLQSRLRMEIGGSSARALAEFYAAIFALCIEGSRLASADRLKEAIACIRDVREAWQIVARDPDVVRMLQEEQLRNGAGRLTTPAAPLAEVSTPGWSA